MCDNSKEIRCQTLSNQFSSSTWSAQPVILPIQISHAWTDSFLMVVIIIKWSVMTTDNPHMQPGTLDSLRGSCLLMHHWNLKHMQMCVGQNHKLEWEPCHCFSACSCLISPGLLMEIFQQTCNFSAHSPHIKFIYFLPPQLHGVKGQTVLVWWWWFGPGPAEVGDSCMR